MRLIEAVYDALRSFDRPCTRAEIEREACLCTVEVKKGLLGLKRRGDLVTDGVERQRAVYSLREGAERPTDQRGQYERTMELREGQRLARKQHRAARPAITILDDSGGAGRPYSPAAGPSHGNAPGAARVVRHGMSLGGTNNLISPCALAQTWRKR